MLEFESPIAWHAAQHAAYALKDAEGVQWVVAPLSTPIATALLVYPKVIHSSRNNLIVYEDSSVHDACSG